MDGADKPSPHWLFAGELPKSTGSPPEPGGLGINLLFASLGLLPPREEALYLASRAAELFTEAGEHNTASAIKKAIAPKRGKGRPREWTEEERFLLAYQVADVWARTPDRPLLDTMTILSRNGCWSDCTPAGLKELLNSWLKPQGITWREFRSRIVAAVGSKVEE